MDSLLPLLAGGTMMIFATCLAAMGIKRFYGEAGDVARHRADYRTELRGLAFLIFGYDSAKLRILVYSLGQSVPMALTVKLLLSRQDGRINPGARLAGIVCVLILAIYAFRAGGTLLQLAATSRSPTPIRCSRCWC